MKKLTFIIAMVFFFASAAFAQNQAPVVTNVHAEQRAGAKLVDITYDVADADGDTLTDIDGNRYHTVVIGNQEWMVENLKVTHYRNGTSITVVIGNQEWMVENLKVTQYRDGTSIPNVTGSTEWAGLSTGAYCTYNNNTDSADTYGHLYNWYAVNDSRGLAPDGWRVPTDADWQTLVDYLGGSSFAGGKLKESGTTHWNSPNTGATNESGFSALPGGYRLYDSGQYSSIGNDAYFWSSTVDNTDNAWSRHLYYVYPEVTRSTNNKRNGFSVRCVRDK